MYICQAGVSDRRLDTTRQLRRPLGSCQRQAGMNTSPRRPISSISIIDCQARAPDNTCPGSSREPAKARNHWLVDITRKDDHISAGRPPQAPDRSSLVGKEQSASRPSKTWTAPRSSRQPRLRPGRVWAVMLHKWFRQLLAERARGMANRAGMPTGSQTVQAQLGNHEWSASQHQDSTDLS